MICTEGVIIGQQSLDCLGNSILDGTFCATNNLEADTMNRIPWNKGKKLHYPVWNKGLKADMDDRVKKNIAACNHITRLKYANGEIQPWNTGLTKETHEGVRRISESKIGDKNHAWKCGRHQHFSGYIMVKKPKHPRANDNGYVMEHILIIEKHIGRYLKKGEVSHHNNGIKDDNRIENLTLFKSMSEHMRLCHTNEKGQFCKARKEVKLKCQDQNLIGKNLMQGSISGT